MVKKQKDELAELVRQFTEVYAGKPNMLRTLSVAAPLLSQLGADGTISDEAMLALSQEARNCALVSMCMATIARGNPELSAMYERIFSFLR